MAGIDRSIIENRIKTIPIKDVCERLHLEHKNKRYRCVNPQHPDNNPSMSISIRNNTWRCFSCDAHGSVIDLVEMACDCEFLDACRWLAQEFSVQLPEGNTNRSIRPKKKPLTKSENRATSITPDTELFEWIVSQGRLSPQATEFLYEERKLSSDVIASCRIFSLNDKYAFISKLVERFGEERCVNSRILSRGRYGLKTNYIFPALAFPYFDYNGNIINIQSRTFNPCTPSERFRNIPGLSVIPFNLNSLKYLPKRSVVYIAEGVTDCLALLSEGKNAIAIPGANNYKEEFAQYLDGYVLVMFPDKDNPGDGLYEKIQRSVRSSVFKKELPDGYKDYADFHIKNASDES